MKRNLSHLDAEYARKFEPHRRYRERHPDAGQDFATHSSAGGYADRLTSSAMLGLNTQKIIRLADPRSLDRAVGKHPEA